MRFLVMDADVLIDFVHTDIVVLALVSTHVGAVHVASPVLEEVEGLGEEQCASLGILVVHPTLEQIAEAAKPVGRLSFQDRLCLITARDGAMTCVTNDRRLLAECKSRGIPTMRGLRLLIELVRAGAMSSGEASARARAIHAGNPLHVTARVLSDFDEELNRIP